MFFDLAGYDVEGYNKFIPYYLFPASIYTVSVSPSTFRTKISVGSNPVGAGRAEAQPGDRFANATAAAATPAWAPSAWSRAN